jgi:hypothetical protein
VDSRARLSGRPQPGRSSHKRVRPHASVQFHDFASHRGAQSSRLPLVKALGAAAPGLLVLDPRQLFTPSFQMTFICVLIVAAIGIPILQRTSQLQKRALANGDSANSAALLPPQHSRFRASCLGTAVCLRRHADGTGLAHGVSLPSATTVGLPSNVIVVPLTQLMMPAAVAALALGSV